MSKNSKRDTAFLSVKSRFTWTKDKTRIDHWRVTHDGPINDDCDGFALTLLWELADRSWIKFWWYQLTLQAVIWHVKSYRGNGHAALWFRGRWADNMEPAGFYKRKDMRHKIIFPYIAPMVAFKLIIGLVITLTKGKN